MVVDVRTRTLAVGPDGAPARSVQVVSGARLDEVRTAAGRLVGDGADVASVVVELVLDGGPLDLAGLAAAQVVGHPIGLDAGDRRDRVNDLDAEDTATAGEVRDGWEIGVLVAVLPLAPVTLGGFDPVRVARVRAVLGALGELGGEARAPVRPVTTTGAAS